VATHFETYLRALDACPDRDGVLGEEGVIHPPHPDYGYESTPRNAITFGCMGVDGVHYSVLAIDGVVTDESPVVQVSPMDFSDRYSVLGDSFLSFLATACGVSCGEMEAVFAAERAGTAGLVGYLQRRFQMARLWSDGRADKLRVLLRHIQPKGGSADAEPGAAADGGGE
jgi:hypothetical protein